MEHEAKPMQVFLHASTVFRYFFDSIERVMSIQWPSLREIPLGSQSQGRGKNKRTPSAIDFRFRRVERERSARLTHRR